MFTGDNVLGHGTAVFEDLSAYISSLELMEKNVAGRAYPGHGPVIEDGKAKVREYIRHRAEREEQVLGVLRGNGGADESSDGWGSMDVVKVIYKDYPESLHRPAEGSVLHVLRKLEKEGRVSCDAETDRWRFETKAVL